ncbi:hypothetical protein Tco_0492375 [Tanacetum coccineum]
MSSNTLQHAETAEDGDPQDQVVFFDDHSFHFGHNEENDEDVAAHRFVRAWGLRDDLLTGPGDTQLQELNCLRTDLQREMQENDECSKKVVLLESAHSGCSDRERELMDRLKDMEKERDNWRQTASE